MLCEYFNKAVLNIVKKKKTGKTKTNAQAQISGHIWTLHATILFTHMGYN